MLLCGEHAVHPLAGRQPESASVHAMAVDRMSLPEPAQAAEFPGCPPKQS